MANQSSDKCINRSYPTVTRHDIYNPSVPYEIDICDMRPNTVTYIGGILYPDAKRFTVNFHIGDDVAFQFDVRQNHRDSRKVIVRNTRQNEKWGKEERDLPYYPFEPDNFFEMLILAKPDCFKVAVNDNHLLSYNHRIGSLSSIDKVTITGDVRLTKVQFQ